VLATITLCTCKISGKSTRVLIKTPINSAVVSGESFRFECASDTTLIIWYFQSYEDQSVLTVYHGQVLNPIFEGILEIELKTGGQCDLIVLNSAFSQTGIYRCKESIGFDPHQTAALIVLESEPVCSTNISGSSVMIGDVIGMSCRVSYTPNLSPALMTWTDPQCLPLTATEYTTEGYLESNITVIATEPPTVDQYRCRTYFDLPPTDSLLTAKNAPEYEYNFTSSVLAVNYCPSTIQITVPSGELRVSDVLYCSADGYPSPTYTWTHVETGQQTTGSTHTINRAGINTFICTATLTIPDQQACTLSTSTNVSVIASSCLELKQANNLAASKRYTLTLSNGKSFEAYCEMGLNGGGYTFLSPESLLDLTDDDIQPLFTDRTNFLMRLRKFDDLQTYTVIRQLTAYRHIPLKLGLSKHEGYRIGSVSETTDHLGLPYLYFGFLPDNMADNVSVPTYGLSVNNVDLSVATRSGSYNYIALLPGFLEAGFTYYESTYAWCPLILTTHQLTIPSSRAMPDEYFMGLDIIITGSPHLCLTTSNSPNMIAQSVRNAAIGFR